MTSGRRGKVAIKPDKRWIRMMDRRADSGRLDWLATECTMTQLSKIWMHSDPNAEAFRAAIDRERREK